MARFGLVKNDVVVLVQPYTGSAGEWVELPDGVTNGCRRISSGGWTCPPSDDYEWSVDSEEWELTPEAQSRLEEAERFSYRDERAAEYRARLSDRGAGRPDVEVLADQLDVIYDYLAILRAAGDELPAALVRNLDERAAIKAEFPKPGQ